MLQFSQNFRPVVDLRCIQKSMTLMCNAMEIPGYLIVPVENFIFPQVCSLFFLSQAATQRKRQEAWWQGDGCAMQWKYQDN